MSEGPQDVLAAEEFVLPTPDPDLRHPVKLPADPSGIARPHDVLAADEFPMPAVRHASSQPAAIARRRRLIGVGLLAVVLLRRRR